MWLYYRFLKQQQYVIGKSRYQICWRQPVLLSLLLTLCAVATWKLVCEHVLAVAPSGKRTGNVCHGVLGMVIG